MLDAILKYIDHLTLTGSAVASSNLGSKYIDELGVRMHNLADIAKEIKGKATFEAHSEAQPCFKIMAVGVEGSGKSTTVNNLLGGLMRSDEDLKVANPKCLTLTVPNPNPNSNPNTDTNPNPNPNLDPDQARACTPAIGAARIRCAGEVSSRARLQSARRA